MSFDKPSDTFRERKADFQVQNPFLVQLLVSLVKDSSPKAFLFRPLAIETNVSLNF